ncbi:MAG TPA: hypothetical protein VGL58_11765 [Caulobacteraceae bacterium]|jgi:hypothetical protein
MEGKRIARLCLAAALMGAIGAVAVTQVIAKPKPEDAAPPAPPPPPPMPDVALGGAFIRDAAAFESYMRNAEQISPGFTDGGSVAQSLRTGVAYEPAQFQRGEVAFAAVAALQDQAFVQAVRAAGQTPDSRYQIVARIFADPSSVLAFDGGRAAAGLAKAALADDGGRLLLTGKAIRQSAYDVQRQAWSKEDVAQRDDRLAAVKGLSTTPRDVPSDDVALLRAKVNGPQLAGPDPVPDPPPYSPLVIRATALAALAAIGQAGDDAVDRLSWMSQDYFTQHCLTHAKNELNECLAVARPNYEDVFCLGQPSLIYTAECVVKGAGATVPLEIAVNKIPIPPLAGGAHHRKR